MNSVTLESVPGVPFAVGKGAVWLHGVPILTVTAAERAGSLRDMVCAYGDRVYIPGSGTFALARDEAAVREVLAQAREIVAALDTLVEVVDTSVMHVVTDALDTQPAAVARALSYALVQHRAGADVDCLAKGVRITVPPEVSPDVAAVLSVYVMANVLSADTLLGVDVALGITTLVNLDTGDDLELFPDWPKW